uniref:Putative secreted protein n=1 Tax=Anopheles triannulatus TaxID=58253 RepID=A0A2M4B5N3_9DIPT
MGNLSEFHWAIRSVLRSTTVILMSGHLSAITLHVGPPTYPAPMQHIFEITISFANSPRATCLTVSPADCSKRLCLSLCPFRSFLFHKHPRFWS